MIKMKNLAIMAVIIIILATVSFMQKSSHQKTTTRSATVTLLEGTWTVDSLSKLTLGRGDETDAVSLIKNSDQSWSVRSAFVAPADTDKIGNLLFNLKDLKGEFRSDKAEVLKDYQLDKDQAVSIRGYDNTGKVAFEILVGKAPMGAQGCFVRLPSDNRVHLSQKNLLSPLGLYNGPARPENKNFIKLKILDIDRLAVNAIVLQDGDKTIELVKAFAQPAPVADEADAATAPDRSTWEWKLAQNHGVALAKTKVDGLMNSLLGMRAVDVDDPTAPADNYGLQSATRKATLHLEDGSSQVVELGSERPAENDGSSASALPAGRWLRVAGENEIWIITDLTMNNIFKTVEDLKAE